MLQKPQNLQMLVIARFRLYNIANMYEYVHTSMSIIIHCPYKYTCMIVDL